MLYGVDAHRNTGIIIIINNNCIVVCRNEPSKPITGATQSDLDSDSESESIESVDPQSSSTVLDSSDSSSIIASAAESGSENDPSITLPVDSHTRNVRICQGPHQS